MFLISLNSKHSSWSWSTSISSAVHSKLLKMLKHSAFIVLKESFSIHSIDVISFQTLLQYPALSLRVRFSIKSPPHLHQSLNHQIQLGNFNIWAGYLVVYDLWFLNQYLVCQPFAIIRASHLRGILEISPSITFFRMFPQTFCKIWNSWVSAFSPLLFSLSKFG